MIKLISILCSLLVFCVPPAIAASVINIATVNNGHMIEMQKLTKEFEKAHPGIVLKWHVYNEGSLRMRVIADIAANEGNYDVVTIGMYETPIWAKRNWLTELKLGSGYQVDDLLPAVRDGLSVNGKLYAAPFYGESSLTMYRKDLVAQTGMSIGNNPTWQQIEQIASKIHNPTQGIYGICLRGKPGWGDNMALFSTMVNSYGGRWFDESWSPQLTSKPWRDAADFYVNLLTQYGPPNSEKNSFNEILKLSRAGKCGIWVDASIAASFLSKKGESQVADQWAFAQAPKQVTAKGANWLWAWALAVPTGSKKPEMAQKFVAWATSQQYIKLIANHNGWANVPTGTRRSTYENPEFIRVAGHFAGAELEALNSADPIDNTLLPSPYQGIQFVSIPEFISIGGHTAQNLSKALAGGLSVADALKASEKVAKQQIKRAGYSAQSN